MGAGEGMDGVYIRFMKGHRDDRRGIFNCSIRRQRQIGHFSLVYFILLFEGPLYSNAMMTGTPRAFKHFLGLKFFDVLAHCKYAAHFQCSNKTQEDC
jgi:hypothetical protein